MLILSSAAISLLIMPLLINAKISISRDVKRPAQFSYVSTEMLSPVTVFTILPSIPVMAPDLSNR
ncbi:hypothetical protein D3C85_1594140 [compost metagenome]